MPSTIRLHRVFKTTPERLYKAFLDRAWLVAAQRLHREGDRMDAAWAVATTCRHELRPA